MHSKKYHWSLAGVSFFLAAVIFAQGNFYITDNQGHRQFLVDYAQFKSDQEGLNRLEIYYKFFNSALMFVKKDGIYKADYEIAVTIYDGKKKQVTAFTQDKTVSVTSYDASISPYDYRISQINYLLPPGKYKIDVTFTDKKSGSKLLASLKAKLIKYDNRNPQFSGIEFVRVVDTAVIDTVFRKGNISIVPSAEREYSGDTTANLLYYFEIYQGSEKTKSNLVETRILDHRLNSVYSDSATVFFGEDAKFDGPIRQVRSVSLKNIKSGDYTLELSILGRRNRTVDRAKSQFTLYWKPESMILNDYKMAVRQLKYIADPEDIKKLKNAETPQDRLNVWNDFWKTRDPTPKTFRNEVRESYYRRIENANRMFGILKKAGWRSDRGMIYIQYGQPDQIEDYPFELSTKAYQVWHFYSLKSSSRYIFGGDWSGEPRRFVFIDEWGDGDFRLQYPYDGRSW